MPHSLSRFINQVRILLALLMISLSGCGGSSSHPPTSHSSSLSSHPSSTSSLSESSIISSSSDANFSISINNPIKIFAGTEGQIIVNWTGDGCYQYNSCTPIFNLISPPPGITFRDVSSASILHLEISVDSTVSPGDYTITIQGTNGSNSHTTQMQLTVLPPNTKSIYVAGYQVVDNKQKAVYWKDGQINMLSDGTSNEVAEKIIVHNNDVYVLSRSIALPITTLWKNGEILDNSNQYQDIGVYNGDLYLAGNLIGTNEPFYSKNGTLHLLPKDTGSILYKFYVDATGNFYAAGPASGASVWFWINDTLWHDTTLYSRVTSVYADHNSIFICVAFFRNTRSRCVKSIPDSQYTQQVWSSTPSGTISSVTRDGEHTYALFTSSYWDEPFSIIKDEIIDHTPQKFGPTTLGLHFDPTSLKVSSSDYFIAANGIQTIFAPTYYDQPGYFINSLWIPLADKTPRDITNTNIPQYGVIDIEMF